MQSAGQTKNRNLTRHKKSTLRQTGRLTSSPQRPHSEEIGAAAAPSRPKYQRQSLFRQRFHTCYASVLFLTRAPSRPNTGAMAYFGSVLCLLSNAPVFFCSVSHARDDKNCAFRPNFFMAGEAPNLSRCVTKNHSMYTYQRISWVGSGSGCLTRTDP